MSDLVLRRLSREYDVVSYYENQNSAHGICYKNKRKFFYKSSSNENIQNEILGYNNAKIKIRTPSIEQIINLEDGRSILVYKYENSIVYNQGLMCDILNDDTSLLDYSIALKKIFDMYMPDDCKPINLNECVSYKRFIIERRNTRLSSFFADVLNQKFILGSKSIIVGELLNRINATIDKIEPIGILSHGDPGDLNIGIQPIFFDLETYGYNPISLEFATFFWNAFLGGAYFFPKYHNNKYIFHNNVFRNMDMINMSYTKNDMIITVDSVKIRFSEKRLYTLHSIIDLFKRIIDEFKIHITDEEIVDILIFRMLTIVDYNIISQDDRVLIWTMVLVLEKNISDKPFQCLELLLSKIKDGDLLLETL